MANRWARWSRRERAGQAVRAAGAGTGRPWKTSVPGRMPLPDSGGSLCPGTGECLKICGERQEAARAPPSAVTAAPLPGKGRARRERHSAGRGASAATASCTPWENMPDSSPGRTQQGRRYDAEHSPQCGRCGRQKSHEPKFPGQGHPDGGLVRHGLRYVHGLHDLRHGHGHLGRLVRRRFRPIGIRRPLFAERPGRGPDRRLRRGLGAYHGRPARQTGRFRPQL